MTAAYLQRATTRDKRIAPPRAYGRYAVAVRLRDTVVRLVREVGAGKRVVDLGCGDMPYRGLVSDVVSSYEGVDLPGNALAKYAIHAGGTCSAPDSCADTVVSTQVLEHARDVPTYLRECRRLLTDDGQLVLTTHGTWVYHGDPHDYWRWTSEGLRTAIEEAGFKIERFEGVLGLMPMGIQMFQDGLVRKLPKWSRGSVCFVLQQALLLADRLHTEGDRARDACVFAVVARKVPESL